jgi:hypothetical protein
LVNHVTVFLENMHYRNNFLFLRIYLHLTPTSQGFSIRNCGDGYQLY